MKRDATKPSAWIVDVDGTLALRGSHEGVRHWFDWTRVLEDAPNWPVIELVRALSMSSRSEIIVMSGREDVCREDTSKWLARHVIPHDMLLMRPAGDYRPDDIVKAELFDTHIADRYDVRGVIDDRSKVVAMWRARGLMCAQVAPGDF